MAVNSWMKIWLDWQQHRSLEELEHSLLMFHGEHNDRFTTHWLAHGSLFGCAVMQKSPKKIATQGWLWCAVLPVHSRNKLFQVIRDVVQNPA